MNRKVYVAIAFLLFSGMCHGIDRPRIVSPANGTVVNPGQSISIAVTADPSMQTVFLATELGQSGDSSRDPNSGIWHFSFTVAPNARIGQYQISAIGSHPGKDPLSSDAITLDVESALTATSIAVVSSELDLSPGDGLLIALI